MSKEFDAPYKETQKIFSKVEKRPHYREKAQAFDLEYAIAMALHEARTKAKLSQRDLAERLHTTQSVISRMESGNANTTIAKLRDYAEACGGTLQVKIGF